MPVKRAVWTVIVAVFACFAVAGPAIMVRDSLAGGDQAASDEPLVVMADLRFRPSDLQVPAGTTVVWNNQDVAPHTVTTDVADSGLIDPGSSFTMIVDSSVDYACTLHPSMTGTIRVT